MRQHRSILAAGLAALAALALVIALAAGPAAAGNRAHVKILNFHYHPKTIDVAKGTRVVFANKDKTPHTATKKGVFNTGKIKPGTKETVKLRHKGTFRYICLIHPFMHGKVIVH